METSTESLEIASSAGDGEGESLLFRKLLKSFGTGYGLIKLVGIENEYSRDSGEAREVGER